MSIDIKIMQFHQQRRYLPRKQILLIIPKTEPRFELCPRIFISTSSTRSMELTERRWRSVWILPISDRVPMARRSKATAIRHRHQPSRCSSVVTVQTSASIVVIRSMSSSSLMSRPKTIRLLSRPWRQSQSNAFIQFPVRRNASSNVTRKASARATGRAIKGHSNDEYSRLLPVIVTASNACRSLTSPHPPPAHTLPNNTDAETIPHTFPQACHVRRARAHRPSKATNSPHKPQTRPW